MGRSWDAYCSNVQRGIGVMESWSIGFTALHHSITPGTPIFWVWGVEVWKGKSLGVGGRAHLLRARRPALRGNAVTGEDFGVALEWKIRFQVSRSKFHDSAEDHCAMKPET